MLFNLYVNDIPMPSHHIELAQYANDTTLVATSKKLILLKYPQTGYLLCTGNMVLRLEVSYQY
jgi:hypothetical protein